MRQAVNPVGDSRPDWEILSALSVLMGAPIEYGDAREILKEIRSLIPGYGLLGPTPMPPKIDQTVLGQYLKEGFAEDLSERYNPAPPAPAASGTLTMYFGQTLFHSGKLSTRSKGLLQMQQDSFVTLNSADATRLGLAESDRVKISNSRGAVTTVVKIRDRVPQGWSGSRSISTGKPNNWRNGRLIPGLKSPILSSRR
ncbi:MAG: molybdopterin dinucleotide binding domain-containing protein [Nitrospiraceae bacterium]